MAYFNKKAQSLTELAAFGSILLLVLSFLISYGMRYNYQQDAQMRAFRMAMSEAYKADRPDASATITLVEDKHIPDPRDMFGAGNIVPVQANAEVTWGNTMQNSYNDLNSKDLPRIKYKIKDKDNYKDWEYTTAGFANLTPAGKNQTNPYFYTDIPGKGRVAVRWADARIYNPVPVEDPANPGKFLPATQVKVLIENDPATDKDNETEVISAVSRSETGALQQIIRVYPEDGKDGDAVKWFLLLSPETGDINPYYLNINNSGVTPDKLQGLLLDEKRLIKRKGTLILEKTPGPDNYKSTSSGVTEAIINRNIRTNSKIDNVLSNPKWKY